MNQNRSMQAHSVLMKQGFDVQSYGTNDTIKLPGETLDRPNVYMFGQTYEEIHKDLCLKNERYYRESGILYLLERNMGIKSAPENFFARKEMFDLLVTCDEKVFIRVCEQDTYGTNRRLERVPVVNFDIKDTAADAVRGANSIAEFVVDVSKSKAPNVMNAVEDALRTYFERYEEALLFTVVRL